MSAVWKFGLAVVDQQVVQAPRGSRPLSAQLQGEVPQLWMLVKPSDHLHLSTFEIRIAGTGHHIDGDDWQFVSTFQLDGGALVFHVFCRASS